jgi:hypothetical protein
MLRATAMLPSSMRLWVWAVALLGLACRPAPHIDLALRMDHCAPFAGTPKAPTSCAGMSLECASFVEARVYESNAGGTVGRILGSSCVPATALGTPPDLCALQMRSAPFALLTDLPDGKTVRFRLRALTGGESGAACNVDLPGQAPPTLLFDGFSPPVAIDGNDHRVVIQLGVCGSCGVVAVEACESQMLPADCLPRGSACPDGSPALFVNNGCCGVCAPT